MGRKKLADANAVENAEVFTHLKEIASNTWWSWNPQAQDLFERANPDVYLKSDKNPWLTVKKLTLKRKRVLVDNIPFVEDVAEVHKQLQEYLDQKTWYSEKYAGRLRSLIAYFCMEYAIHESLPFYAGGLGVLAGDHLKSASDLGLPMIAIGMYWKKGYTRQHIDKNGKPVDEFRLLTPENTPLQEVVGLNGHPLRLKVTIEDRTVQLRAWQLDVGRIPLYLLDADIMQNERQDRQLTHVLYSGDRATRVRQEIILGIGGWQLIRHLKLNVSACHLNEGHAAFVQFERIVERMHELGETYKKAAKTITESTVFTTHTPIPAGNEEFDPKLIDKYFGVYQKRLKLTHEEFHDLARVKPGARKENFGMTPLALHTSKFSNGVAALHGKIARKMWKHVYPVKKMADVPIGHVTNGIHLKTWLHPEMGELLEKYLGKNWEHSQDQARLWAKCKRIPDQVLWDIHQKFKEELIEFCRSRLEAQEKRTKTHSKKRADLDMVLDPKALTIGFARRFAPYKRATLAFNDAPRLAKILNSQRMPVQIIFAGKAHPADVDGKKLIQQLIKYSHETRFRRRIFFIEDYEMEVARHMVAGVDIWLNNPERPREASGTSGMKPALHGGLNLSILDGWWPEGYNKKNGWAIGTGKDHDGTKASNKRDANELYKILEKEAVPAYFKIDKSTGLPLKWIEMMKNSLMSIPPFFNTHRQVKEYLTKYYHPAMRKSSK